MAARTSRTSSRPSSVLDRDRIPPLPEAPLEPRDGTGPASLDEGVQFVEDFLGWDGFDGPPLELCQAALELLLPGALHLCLLAKTRDEQLGKMSPFGRGKAQCLGFKVSFGLVHREHLQARPMPIFSRPFNVRVGPNRLPTSSNHRRRESNEDSGSSLVQYGRSTLGSASTSLRPRGGHQGKPLIVYFSKERSTPIPWVDEVRFSRIGDVIR